jgi:hypothetical protein
MPMSYSLVIKPFDCWGFDFMGPFPPLEGYTHILVAIDYVTKWVELIPMKSADGETLLKMLKGVILLGLVCLDILWLMEVLILFMVVLGKLLLDMTLIIELLLLTIPKLVGK